ncbi:Exonuclease domain-containing protein [Plasmodiophora brassicae]
MARLAICLAVLAGAVQVSLSALLPSRICPFVWDTETTGLNRNRDRIIEISVRHVPWLVGFVSDTADEFTVLVNPNRTIGGSHVHGISYDDVVGKPGFGTRITDLIAFVERVCDQDRIPLFLAHNSRFDVDMFESEIWRLSAPIRQGLESQIGSWKFACTMRDIARKLVIDASSYGMRHLTMMFNITNHAAHRAFGDVDALDRLLRAMVSRSPVEAIAVFEEVLQAAIGLRFNATTESRPVLRQSASKVQNVDPFEDVTRYKSCIPGLSDKNLFLKDKKGKRFFVVLVSEDKCVDLPALAKLLDVGHLSMASLERMTAVLGVSGGAVSPLAVVDDHAGKVRVIDDR